MPKVIIPQKNIVLEVEHSANLMNLLLTAGLPVASSCQGDGVCSMCRVQIEGDVAAPGSVETGSLGRNKCTPSERLSCQIEVRADVTVRTRYW